MNRVRSWAGVSIVLAIAGIAVAGYLSYVAYNHDALSCSVGDCLTVQSSDYATLLGVPIALLGLGMYVTVLGLGVWRLLQPGYDDIATFAIFAIVLSGAIYAGYLTYVEIWVIEAICQWCVIPAVLTVGLVISESVMVTRLLRE